MNVRVNERWRSGIQTRRARSERESSVYLPMEASVLASRNGNFDNGSNRDLLWTAPRSVFARRYRSVDGRDFRSAAKQWVAMIAHRKMFLAIWTVGLLVTLSFWVFGVQVPVAFGWIVGVLASVGPAFVRLLS